MKLMPLNVIRKRLVYGLEILLGYQVILDLGGAQTLEGRDGSKEVRDSMKVEEGSVHCKRYDGRCTKQ